MPRSPGIKGGAHLGLGLNQPQPLRFIIFWRGSDGCKKRNVTAETRDPVRDRYIFSLTLSQLFRAISACPCRFRHNSERRRWGVLHGNGRSRGRVVKASD